MSPRSNSGGKRPDMVRYEAIVSSTVLVSGRTSPLVSTTTAFMATAPASTAPPSGAATDETRSLHLLSADGGSDRGMPHPLLGKCDPAAFARWHLRHPEYQ